MRLSLPILAIGALALCLRTRPQVVAGGSSSNGGSSTGGSSKGVSSYAGAPRPPERPGAAGTIKPVATAASAVQAAAQAKGTGDLSVAEGIKTGAAIGGSIGSVVPGIGTAIGTGIGGAIGAVAGIFT